MCGATAAGTLHFASAPLFSIGPINYNIDSGSHHIMNHSNDSSDIALASASTVYMYQSSISPGTTSKKRRLCSSNSNNTNDPLGMKVHDKFIVNSAPNIKKRKIQHIISSLPRSRSPTTVVESPTCNDNDNDNDNNTSSCSPHKTILDVLSSKGREAIVRPSLNVTNFFVHHTQEQINAYDMEVIRAVRSQDIDQLRSMHKAGRTLQCANRFGESLIHMACRRGFTDVVRFLVDEANVSIKVRDDYGRTPLHDACWTCEPNEELVEFLMLQCPELLLMSDKRGNAPFEYVRTEHWARWVTFLSERRGKICLSHTSTCMVTVG